VVTIAPDYSPSAIHADYHLPVRIGTDAVLVLAMCKVIIDADLYDKEFVQAQTDLPLLVRKDTGGFLRGSEVLLAPRAHGPSRSRPTRHPGQTRSGPCPRPESSRTSACAIGFTAKSLMTPSR
jgi:anaerobic selenocysteine-containing dehydrogenase